VLKRYKIAFYKGFQRFIKELARLIPDLPFIIQFKASFSRLVYKDA